MQWLQKNDKIQIFTDKTKFIFTQINHASNVQAETPQP